MSNVTTFEQMLELVENFIKGEFYTPMDIRALDSVLAIDATERDLFVQAVEELLKNGTLFETKTGKLILAENSGLLKGTFSATTRGFGFFRQDGNSADELYIAKENTGGAMHGDRVQVKLVKTGSDKEGEVVRILEHAVVELVGTLREQKAPTQKNPKGKKVKRASATRFTVRPDDPRHTFKVDVLPAQANGAKDGDKVLVRLTKYPTVTSHGDRTHAMGRVARIFGRTNSLGANYGAILHTAGIKQRFDEETIAEARAIEPGCVLDGRLDLRDKIIFTIDGADAKDFDDAISIERDGDGYRLGVHIADVSHYVRAHTALDKEAMTRGTSVYFTDKVVPMLPEELSNGVCSLNTDGEKYALSAILHIDSEGELLEADFRESVIVSRVRGVYSEVNDVLALGADSEYYDKYAFLLEDTLPVMVELYEKLLERSRERGSLEIETTEAAIILNEDGMPTDIRARERGVSERMIEQFMLAANRAAASWLTSMSLPCIYRVHEEPTHEKVETFVTFVHNLGLDMRPLKRRKLLPSAYREVYDEAISKELASVVTPVMLRSLMKAHYSDVPSPHFGLAADLYCHFTSPIRRYPDLATHRIIKAAISGQIDDKRLAKLESFAHDAALSSNEAELRAMSAERDIEDLYKTLYMSTKIGQKFEGVISSVTSFGFFVELADTCEGLVPINSLDGWFAYSESRRELNGGGITYSLGQRVRVRVVSCDVISRRVEFDLI